jgi:3-deoxy-D-manno-octulosonic-acid transferase
MMLYSVLLLMVLVVGAPWWLVRMMTSGRYRAGLAGRLGWVPAELKAAVAGREVVWVHAVSVGEVVAATRLVEELRVALPGCVVAVSTTTATGQALAKRKLAGSPVFYLPLDFGVVVRRYLRVLRPRMMVLMESELWPNLIGECSKTRVPVAVVNARVSDRSFPRYMRLRRLWRPLLAQVSLFLAQSKETAERLVRIGAEAERVRVTGNLKYDSRAGAVSPLVGLFRENLASDAVVVVCGSTLEGEERLLLEAWPEIVAAEPKAVMVLAPRHPDRFAAVAGLAAGSGFGVERASEFRELPVGVGYGDIFVLDTIGDLATMYSVAAVAFVGGSLVPMGGHNPLEAAQFAVPVVMGGSYENFREMVEKLLEAKAICLVGAEQLAGTIAGMLVDRKAAREVGERGLGVFEAQAGATGRTVGALMEMLRGGR